MSNQSKCPVWGKTLNGNSVLAYKGRMFYFLGNGGRPTGTIDDEVWYTPHNGVRLPVETAEYLVQVAERANARMIKEWDQDQGNDENPAYPNFWGMQRLPAETAVSDILDFFARDGDEVLIETAECRFIEGAIVAPNGRRERFHIITNDEEISINWTRGEGRVFQ